MAGLWSWEIRVVCEIEGHLHDHVNLPVTKSIVCVRACMHACSLAHACTCMCVHEKKEIQICVYVSEWVCSPVHGYTQARGWFQVSSYCFSLEFLRQRLSLNLELAVVASFVDPGSMFLCLPRVTDVHHCLSLAHGCWGSEFSQVFILGQLAQFPRNHVPNT